MKKYFLILLLFGILVIGFFIVQSEINNEYCEGGPLIPNKSFLKKLSIQGEDSKILYQVFYSEHLGLNDLTNKHSVTLKKGKVYDLEVILSNCNLSKNVGCEAYLDYDQNYNFTLEERIAYTQDSNHNIETHYVFKIPKDAKKGDTRLRFVQTEDANLPLDPCAIFTWGSLTDFKVTIID